MKAKIRISVLTTLFIAILIISGCSSTGSSSRKMGNTNANISNGGMSVMRDGWLYFMNYSDKNALYKVKTDGTGEVKVSDDMAYYLNSYGDWLYYCNGSENGKIYKVKPDGSERTMISENISQNIIVAEDWIYYINHTDGNNAEEYRRIFKMKTDGTGRQKVSSDDSRAFNIDGEWIYFISNRDQKLYKIKTDGSGQVKVSDAIMEYFNILDDNIYYLDSSEGNNRLWRMKIDGTGGEMLSEEKIAAFNASGDWIYYSNTLSEEIGFELKKMKLNGADSIVMNEDDPVSINVHDDLLLYLCFDFKSFGVNQTIMKADGTGRKDYVYVPTPQAQDVVKYSMNEPVEGNGLTFTVTSAYSTNIIKNDEPGFESEVFDDVDDGIILFVNMTIANRSDKDVDLMQMIGLIEDIDAAGLTVYWSQSTDITSYQNNGDIRFHLPRDQYYDSAAMSKVIGRGDTRVMQTLYTLPEATFPVFLGIFNGIDINPLAAIEVLPGAEDYVTSWSQSIRIIEEKFPGYDVVQHNGAGYKFENEDEEKMYYTFEVKKPGATEAEYYLVKRETGEIYIGAYDANYPDYKAVPIRPID